MKTQTIHQEVEERLTVPKQLTAGMLLLVAQVLDGRRPTIWDIQGGQLDGTSEEVLVAVNSALVKRGIFPLGNRRVIELDPGGPVFYKTGGGWLSTGSTIDALEHMCKIREWVEEQKGQQVAYWRRQANANR